MLNCWNTLIEAADYLSRETKEGWTDRKVLQVCLDKGIFPKLQFLARDRNDVPEWMSKGGMVELPFNVDLQSFLAGDGCVEIVRHDNKIYQFNPSLLLGIERLRLSKDDLNNLLSKVDKEHNDINLKRETEQINLPEKMPTNAIGRVAVEVAFEIWQESGIKPVVNQVMARIKHYAGTGEKHSDVLRPSPTDYRGRGVHWATGRYKKKEYTVDACSTALRRYLK